MNYKQWSENDILYFCKNSSFEKKKFVAKKSESK